MKINWNKRLTMFTCMICILVLCGCSSKEKDECKEKVSCFLKGYHEQDKTCGKYLSGNEEDSNIEFEGFQSILADSMSYEIQSVELNDDNNIVHVVITNVDFGSVFDELVNNDNLEINTTEDAANVLKEKLQAKDVPMRDFEVEVQLDDEQKIQMTSELSNALLGGYPQYISEVTEEGVQ